MKRFLTIFSLFLLIFNSTGALYGGISFIIHPDGSGIGMSLSYLQYAPFDNYFIPGIILILANGVWGIVTIVFVLIRHRKSFLLILAQGAILCIWLLVQMIMIRVIIPLHFIMGTTGLLLIVSGWRLKKLKS